jgi:hypothetical protein
MGNFSINNNFTSKDNSVVSGSLSITGGITGSLYVTASFVYSSSHTINASTASYTTVILADSASYSTNALTASLANTASYSIGPSFAPTNNIGYISPNIYIGDFNGFNTAATTFFGGVLFTPVTINKNCTLTTMSIAGGGQAGMTASCGVYSNNSTTNLPEYRLTSGTIESSISTPCNLIHSKNLSPINLKADTIYWVAFSGHVNFRWTFSNSNVYGICYNPLLGTRISTVAGSTIAHTVAFIRSGSQAYSLALAPTCSQATGSYFLNQPSYVNTPVLPVLKVTY